MSQLLALSFDCSTTPSLTLKAVKVAEDSKEEYHGWGFGWYPAEGNAAAIIKDSCSDNSELTTHVLTNWKRFYSTLFMCYLRGAAKRLNQQDTQPFSRSYAGRDWVLLHNGDFTGDYRTQLMLSKNPLFEPLGITDSEHIFCWLMEKVQSINARCIADIDWTELHQWFTQINDCGTANIFFSDGHDIAVYQDKNLFNPLCWIRKHPPHQQVLFESDALHMEINDDHSTNRTFVLVATQQPFFSDAQQMDPGQLLVIRRGAVIWNSCQGLPLLQDNQPIDEQLLQTVVSPVPSEQPTENKENIIYHYNVADCEKFEKLAILNIRHETIYRYTRPVEFSTHVFRLHPVQNRHQELLEHTIKIQCPGVSETFDDVFGNRISFIQIDTPYTELQVTMTARVRLGNIPATHSSRLQTRQTIPLAWMPWQRQMMMPYLLPPELPESELKELIDFAMSFVSRNDNDVLALVKDINRTIYHDFIYLPGITTVQTTAFEIYKNRQGVCQDFANLFICLARLLSIPARYRAGYLYTGNNYQNKLQSEATHAWVELYIPWLGWRGFDPTNGCLTGKDHISLACGRNYADATPTSGTIFVGGGSEYLLVDVKVAQDE